MHAESATARCPFQATPSQDGGLRADEWLALPQHRRAVVQTFDLPDGGRELRLFYGDKEISFDDPAFFAFGEGLVAQARFRAGDAAQWGGQRWADVQPLLAELIEQGILQRVDAGAEAPRVPRDGARPAPLPPGPNPTARGWSDSEALLAELTGRPLETGWLELVVPVFRVAHMALDADGRQVGEANVFPPAMRMDVPTNWRECIYPGTRHQIERPMNVTALKAMRQHWNSMMRLLQPVRAAYLRRFPQARRGWTVGHLERLATAVLGLATWPLVRANAPVANGELHPALSSLFRVTDGLRMTMHQMLFVPIGEPTVPADTPMTSAQVLDYAERNYSFHSEHGVCAGPRSMVEEFLAVLIDGRPVAAEAALDDDLLAALADLEPAFDYAMLGLKAHAVVFSVWPLMARRYEALAPLAAAWQQRAGAEPAVGELAERLRERVARIRSATYLAQESWRADREAVYADMYAQCAAGAHEASVVPLPEQVAARRDRRDGELVRRLLPLLQARFGSADTDFAVAVVDFLLQEQALLRVAAAAQAQVNTLVGRAAPKRAFDARDVDLHVQLQGSARRTMPDLVAELEQSLGLRIELDTERLEIQPEPTTTQPAAASPEIRPAEGGPIPVHPARTH